MRAFITGVTGFAGSHLAEHLLSCGDAVLGCSQSTTWPVELHDALAGEVSLFRWDLAKGVTSAAEDQIRAFRPAVVYHLAAVSVPADCGQQDPASFATAVNVDGTAAVIDACRELDPLPKLVFASSCYVYAPVPRESPLVNEATLPRPHSAYGKTKLAAERRILAAVKSNHVPAVIARAYQHTGPRQSARMVLPDWSRQLVTPNEEPVRAICLDTYLDLSDVRDVVRAYRALALDGIAGTVYNVGSGICRRSGDLLEAMQRCAATQRPVIELEPGVRQHPVADISRLTQTTGWKPEVDLEQTIFDTLDYWRKQGRAA